jgi:SAM-dependent methyltransferase
MYSGDSEKTYPLDDIKLVDVPCPVCGSDSRSILFEETRREPAPMGTKGAYVRCHECDMIYLCPVPDWDEFKKYYDLLSDFFTDQGNPAVTPLRDQEGFAGWLYHRLFRFLPHAWPQEEGDERKLLDVGCGNGDRLIEFAKRDWRIFGTDVSASTLAVAQRTIPTGVFLEGELENVDLPLGSFDVIRMDNVLEHVPEPKRLLRRCRELLNSEGRLYIYVPHGRSISVRLLGRYSYSAWAPFHLHLFTVSALKRILLDVGFSSVEILQFSPHSWIPGSFKLLLGITDRISLPYIIERCLMAAFLPVGYIASRIGWGEELVAISRK